MSTYCWPLGSALVVTSAEMSSDSSGFAVEASSMQNPLGCSATLYVPSDADNRPCGRMCMVVPRVSVICSDIFNFLFHLLWFCAKFGNDVTHFLGNISTPLLRK